MSIRQLTLIISLSFILLSCLSKNNNAKVDLITNNKNFALIEGNIVKNINSSKDIYLILFRETIVNNNKILTLVDFSTHSKAESFKIKVNLGRYFLHAYQNKENITDKKIGYEFISNIIVLNENNRKKKIVVKMPSTTVLVSENNILIGNTSEKSIFKKFSKIKNTNLTDSIFSRTNSKMGLFKPLKFYDKVGGGIYVLGNFSANKVPILFIHGLNGTPRDFSHIINQIDKNKYQIIVYYYATGVNLNYSVDGLNNSITKLKEKYGFNKLVIVAHSMGGLVSRGFINNLDSSIIVEKYITISTPWNGQKFAEYAGKIAFRIVPSFLNMVPGSVYQKKILSKPFPKRLSHYLFFGYKAKNSFVLENSNDGVISLSSQLYESAQDQASFIIGYNETHSSILKSEKLINKILQILK